MSGTSDVDVGKVCRRLEAHSSCELIGLSAYLQSMNIDFI